MVCAVDPRESSTSIMRIRMEDIADCFNDQKVCTGSEKIIEITLC